MVIITAELHCLSQISPATDAIGPVLPVSRSKESILNIQSKSNHCRTRHLSGTLLAFMPSYVSAPISHVRDSHLARVHSSAGPCMQKNSVILIPDAPPVHTSDQGVHMTCSGLGRLPCLPGARRQGGGYGCGCAEEIQSGACGSHS